MSEVKSYGPHLTLDLEHCDPTNLNNLQFVFNLLSDLPAKIGMEKLTTPYVFPYDGGDVPQDDGITGVVIIAESHISIHTYASKGYVFIDIFSCKPFDTEFAAKYLIETFGAKKHTQNVVERGINFPRSTR